MKEAGEGSNRSSNAIYWPQQRWVISVQHKKGYLLLCFSFEHYDTVALKLFFSHFLSFTFLCLAQECKKKKKRCSWSFWIAAVHSEPFTPPPPPHQKLYFLSPPTETENFLEYVKTIGATMAFCSVRTTLRASRLSKASLQPKYAALPPWQRHRVSQPYKILVSCAGLSLQPQGKCFQEERLSGCHGSAWRCFFFFCLPAWRPKRVLAPTLHWRHDCVIKGWQSLGCDGLSEHQR